MTKRPGSSGWQNKNNYLAGLRRIEGQTRGLQPMIEDDKASFVLSHLGSAPGRRALGRPAPAGAVDVFAHPPLPGAPGQDCPGRPVRSEG